MNAEELRARSKKFAVDVIRFAKTIPKEPIHDEIAVQLTDAATSTAAHYRAACRAKSRADFINKLGGAIEEVDESALATIATHAIDNKSPFTNHHSPFTTASPIENR